MRACNVDEVIGLGAADLEVCGDGVVSCDSCESVGGYGTY